MTAFDVTAAGRRLADSRMTSTCRIFTPGGLVTDPVTSEVTHAEVDPVTTRCRVRPAGAAGNSGGNGRDVGGAEVVAAGFVVSVPFAVNARPLQHLVVTSCPDPSLVDLTLEVRQVARGDNISARRLLCEEAA